MRTDKMRNLLILFFTFSILIPPMSFASDNDEAVLEIDWDDLIAKDWYPETEINAFLATNPTAEELYVKMERLSAMAPVETSLNSKIVKLAGYLLPLQHDGTKVSEFLLLPYHGACIHVPAPPANQVVYAKTAEPVAITGLFTAVSVTGRMSTVSVISELAEAGYTMEAYEITPYQ